MFDNRIALTVREAAEATGFSQESIRLAIRCKRLRASRPGGSGNIRIMTEDLRVWLAGDGEPSKRRPSFPTARNRAA